MFAHCGLYPVREQAQNALPLVNAKVHYDLVDVQALATIVQTYTSTFTDPLEVKYVFPLPPDASVCSFKAVIDDKRIINGVVKEKSKAKEEYEEAVSQGKTAALLEQGNVEIFQVSLGNIYPQQTIQIHISFASILSQNGGLDSLRLTFPTYMSPIYGGYPNELVDYSRRIFPWSHSLVHQFINALDFSVAVHMTSPVKAITSPSHPIGMKLGESTEEPSADFDPCKARVHLSSPSMLDKDIIITLTCQGLDKPRCTMETFLPDEGAQEYTEAYSLTLVPRFELPPLPAQEYIFLVDRSGSMGTTKMGAVRSSLQIMLRSLPPRGTTFNIISFGSSASSLWPSNVPYTAESVKAASVHVDTMSSNFGGTEIRLALKAAFKSRSDITIPATVFILTDGQASDLEGVKTAIAGAVKQAKAFGSLLRVFSMGIGNAVSKAMCDLIARTGNGSAVYVQENESPDEKLMGMLRAARCAIVENLSIDWGTLTEDDNDDFEIVSAVDAQTAVREENSTLPPLSLFTESAFPQLEKERSTLGPDDASIALPPPPRIQQAPSRGTIPPLYPGFRTSIFAIIRSDNPRPPPKSVIVKGTAMGRQVQLEVPVTQVMSPRSSGENNIKMLHVLAARALVQRFEDDTKGSFKTAVLKAEILRVAERYGIASSETSFVAVDEEGATLNVQEGPDEHGATKELWRSLSHYAHLRPTAKRSRRARGCARSPDTNPSPLKKVRVSSGSRGRGGSSVGVERERERERSLSSIGTSAGGPPNLFGMGSYHPMGMHSSSNEDIQIVRTHLREATAPQQQQVSQQALQKLARIPHHDRLVQLSPQQMHVLQTQDYQPASSSFLQLQVAPSVSQAFSSYVTPIQNSLNVEDFARIQTFEGSFTGSATLYQALLQSLTVPSLPDELTLRTSQAEEIWTTLLCVAYLELKLAERKDVWVLMVEKAMAWIEDALQAAGVDEVLKIRDTLMEKAKKEII